MFLKLDHVLIAHVLLVTLNWKGVYSPDFEEMDNDCRF